MNKFKKIIFNIKVFFNSFFRGLKSADDVIEGTMQDGASKGIKIDEQIEEDSVYKDLLNEEITQEVIEMRDSTYRVEKHSQDYKYLGNGNIIKTEGPKIVSNDNDFEVLVSQKNQCETKNVLDVLDEICSKEWKDDDFTIKIERDFCPTFKIEKYFNRLTIKKKKKTNEYFFDLFFDGYGYTDDSVRNIFISKLNKIYKNYELFVNDDIFNFNNLSFITYKADGAYDFRLFKVGEPVLYGVSLKNGEFILTFKCNMICNGIDLTEKYKTKEMDKKYEEKAPKLKNGLTVEFTDVVAEEKDDFDLEKAENLLNMFNNKK